MGKGDKKTKRGKIVKGTFGVRRSRKKKSADGEGVKQGNDKKKDS